MPQVAPEPVRLTMPAHDPGTAHDSGTAPAGTGGAAAATELLARAAAALEDTSPGSPQAVEAGLELAEHAARSLPLPGHGGTVRLWEALAGLGALDLAVARTVEPHLDALAILAEAGCSAPPAGSTWGVYAAEGAGTRLEAAPAGPDHGSGSVLLSGTKPWCSLAGRLSHALVTAWVDEQRRGLFAVDLRHPAVTVRDGAWHARGLTSVPSGPVDLRSVPATPVGGPGWYLERDGFAWGGIGVAAVWYGGAVGVARRLRREAARRTSDQVALMHLGRADAALWAARACLAEAAAAVDDDRADGVHGALLAQRVRHVVAEAAEQVLATVDRALGPAPLALEADHATRVADLRLYTRQHHAERDAAALGRQLLAADGADDHGEVR